MNASYLKLLAGAALISFSAVFVKIAGTPPTVSAFWRALFGGLVLAGLALAQGHKLWRGPRLALFMAGAALFLGLDLILWHRSILVVGPGLGTILANFQVFFLAALGAVFLRERLTPRYLLAVALAMAGLFMLVGLDHGHRGAGYLGGVSLGICAAACYAFYLLVLRRLNSLPQAPPAVASMAVISLFMAGLVWLEVAAEGNSLAAPNALGWFWLVCYGVLCQGLGWVFISRGLPWVPASRAGLILLLQPTLSFVWDVLFFGRPTAPVEVVGAVLAVAAIYLGSMAKAK